MSRLAGFIKKTKGYGLLVLRLWVGGAMMYYSYGYVLTAGGLTDFASYAGSLGIPFATVLGPIAKIIEFAGGAMILAGFYGRIGALLIALILFVAVVYAHGFQVFSDGGISFNLMMMNLLLVLEGTGKFSLKQLG